MALSIKDPEADRLARQLASMRGVGLTEAIVEALQMRLAQEKAKKAQNIERKMKEIRRIIDEIAHLPVYDTRSPDEIIGFDEHGLPK